MCLVACVVLLVLWAVVDALVGDSKFWLPWQELVCFIVVLSLPWCFSVSVA